ncbi:MAG: HlyD family secretion protein [Sphingomonas taxi]|uniref:HlyD family secretion protein n=1 Tax=Sphingomonas taxi TaxID=1549858 RepID=A0A2W5NX98_9SPHN|nr:MAG: HlyD family secretion protein [Sphingomonas taxi]
MDDMPKDAGAVPDAAVAARRRPSRRTLLAAGIALIVAIVGALWITAAPSSESTDDAYVAADATAVAPRVKGLVAAILVHDNQPVRRGQPLVRIDPEEFDARVQSAEADVVDARAQVEGARAALVSLDAEQQLASAKVTAAAADIRSTEAESGRADADRRRYDALLASGAVARREVEVARSAAVGAEQGAARARALFAVSQREAGVTGADRVRLLAAVDKAQAQRLRAIAALDLARQDQRHTLIVAPIDGVVGNRQAQPGDYVQPGSRLMTLVPVGNVYVTANFKETQTRHMRIGQRASIKVDALGETLTGRVDSLAPGSGSTFSLLPFEPGTGNFTKIVQRVPVRIHFDPGQPALTRLRPGLSVTAKVRLND